MAIKEKIPCPRCDAKGIIPRYYYNRKGICFACWGERHIYVKVPQGKDRETFIKEAIQREKEHLAAHPPKVAMPESKDIRNKAYDDDKERAAFNGGSEEKPKEKPAAAKEEKPAEQQPQYRVIEAESLSDRERTELIDRAIRGLQRDGEKLSGTKLAAMKKMLEAIKQPDELRYYAKNAWTYYNHNTAAEMMAATKRLKAGGNVVEGRDFVKRVSMAAPTLNEAEKEKIRKRMDGLSVDQLKQGVKEYSSKENLNERQKYSLEYGQKLLAEKEGENKQPEKFVLSQESKDKMREKFEKRTAGDLKEMLTSVVAKSRKERSYDPEVMARADYAEEAINDLLQKIGKDRPEEDRNTIVSPTVENSKLGQEYISYSRGETVRVYVKSNNGVPEYANLKINSISHKDRTVGFDVSGTKYEGYLEGWKVKLANIKKIDPNEAVSPGVSEKADRTKAGSPGTSEAAKKDKYQEVIEKHNFDAKKRAKYRIDQRAAAIVKAEKEKGNTVEKRDVAAKLMEQIAAAKVSKADQADFDHYLAMNRAAVERLQAIVKKNNESAKAGLKKWQIEAESGAKETAKPFIQKHTETIERTEKRLKVINKALELKQDEPSRYENRELTREQEIRERYQDRYVFEIEEARKRSKESLDRYARSLEYANSDARKEELRRMLELHQQEIAIYDSLLEQKGDDGTQNNRNRMVFERVGDESPVIIERGALIARKLSPYEQDMDKRLGKPVRERVVGQVVGISHKEKTVTMLEPNGKRYTHEFGRFHNATDVEAHQAKKTFGLGVGKPHIPESTEVKKKRAAAAKEFEHVKAEIETEFAGDQGFARLSTILKEKAEKASNAKEFLESCRDGGELQAQVIAYRKHLVERGLTNGHGSTTNAVYNNLLGIKPSESTAAKNLKENRQEKEAAAAKPAAKNREHISTVGDFQVTTRIHTKTGEVLYAIEPTKKLSLEDFKLVMAEVKKNVGGWYDRKVFKRHLTKEDPTALLEKWLGKKATR